MDIKLSYKKSSVKPSEAISLFLLVGWGKKEDYNITLMNRALQNSDFVVSVRDKKGKLIGLARVLTDTVFYATIPDMIIDPNYQGRGIGKTMMKIIERKYKGVPIFMEIFKKNKIIFKKFGFQQKSSMLVFSKRNGKTKS